MFPLAQANPFVFHFDEVRTFAYLVLILSALYVARRSDRAYRQRRLEREQDLDVLSEGPEKKLAKRRHWPSAVPYIILAPLLYMGAYYATIAHHGGAPNGKYMVGDAQLPDWFDDFFGPAERAEDWLQLGPCRPRPMY